MQNTLFANVEEQPRDPILGMTETFLADKAPHRVNLGVGVYQDENGKVPLLACVKQAEEALLGKAAPHTYVPIDGLPAYDAVVAQMVFADSADLANIATVQTLGGTGALKLGAEMLQGRVARGQGLAQQSRAGKTTARCLAAPASRSKPTPITAPTANWTSPAWSRRWRRFRPATSCCSTPAATTRPASTSTPTSGGRSRPSCGSAGSRPSSTPPTWALPRGWRPTPFRCGCSPPMAARCSSPFPFPSRCRFTASASAP